MLLHVWKKKKYDKIFINQKTLKNLPRVFFFPGGFWELPAPTVPPRGVQPVNPNGGGARYTARLSELYGTNSSGHLWKKQTVKTNSVEGHLWKKKEILPSFIGLWV